MGDVPPERAAAYPYRPIGSIPALARALGVPGRQLQWVVARTEQLYREVPQNKKDGGERMTYDARRPLKPIQGRIVTCLLRKVRFPAYLHGGIRDPRYPRDPFSNAQQHIGTRQVVMEDIQDFFPSIHTEVVYGIWLRFFRFPAEVAECLTRLTTYRGSVPQGAKTSSYLANLAFWDVEPQLVVRLEGQGLRYSRYADDIVVSSVSTLSKEEKRRIIGDVYGMLAAKGCKPKRTKHDIRRRGQRLQITGLVVNGQRPVVSKPERRRIRAAVTELERLVAVGAEAGDLARQYRSAEGRVNRLVRCGHPDGAKLRARLEQIRLQIGS